MRLLTIAIQVPLQREDGFAGAEQDQVCREIVSILLLQYIHIIVDTSSATMQRGLLSCRARSSLLRDCE